jgi:hypothetical protein
MSVLTAGHCKFGSCDAGVATMTEYILLVGVALLIFLSLTGALFAFSATTRNDAAAIAASKVASAIGVATGEAVSSGDTSASIAIELPERICGMPYLAYPLPDEHSILICLAMGRAMQQYRAPIPLGAENVKMAGFITGPPRYHAITFDAATRTVTLQ